MQNFDSENISTHFPICPTKIFDDPGGLSDSGIFIYTVRSPCCQREQVLISGEHASKMCTSYFRLQTSTKINSKNSTREGHNTKDDTVEGILTAR
jgi:hypothetical protein